MGVARWATEVTEIVAPHRCDRERDEDVGRSEGWQTGRVFIFPGDCNGFIDPDKFDLEVWKPIAEKAGMAGTRFHDLRHFFASQLIAQGESAAHVRDHNGQLQHQGDLRHVRSSLPRPWQRS